MPRDHGHHDVQHHGLDAEQRPAAALEHPKANRRRHRDGDDAGKPPVAEPFGAARRRHHVGDVGARGRQQTRPEQAVDHHEAEHELVRRGDRVEAREHGDDRRADQQDAPLAEAVGDAAHERRRDRRGVGEQPEEQAGLGRRAAEREDVERRGRQQLERGQEHREAEPEHQREARREQALRRGHPALSSPGEGAVVRTIFPMCEPGFHAPVRVGRLREGNDRVDDRADASGSSRGQTCVSSSRARADFSSTDRGRSVEPVIHNRRRMTWERSRLTCGVLRNAICTSRPSMASASRFRAV